jgi:hypothetical protein
MVRSLIAFVLGNFTLTFFVIGLLFSAAAIARAPKPRGEALVTEKLQLWFVFLDDRRALSPQRRLPHLLRGDGGEVSRS